MRLIWLENWERGKEIGVRVFGQRQLEVTGVIGEEGGRRSLFFSSLFAYGIL